MSIKLQVWHIPQVPMQGFRVDVDSPDSAALVLLMLAEYDLYELYMGAKPDFSNADGLETNEFGDWEEWYTPEGDLDIDGWTDLHWKRPTVLSEAQTAWLTDILHKYNQFQIEMRVKRRGSSVSSFMRHFPLPFNFREY